MASIGRVIKPFFLTEFVPLFWIGAALLWMLAWIGNDALAHSEAPTKSLGSLRDFVVPAVFGITLLFLWQLIVKGFGIPAVLLPAPSDIWTKLIASLPILRDDFIQTFMRAVLPGWAIGSLSGFLVAILCDACGFLRRGLLPLGNLVAALADRRRRAHHGHVVRLRLAVEGGGGGHHDVLPDAGERGDGACRRQAISSAT